MSKRGDNRYSLFDGPARVEYLVDTSSWIALYDHVERDRLWPIVEVLIRRGRLFSPTRVVGTQSDAAEVISARTLIEAHLEQLTQCDRNDVDFYQKVGVITARYPRMAKPTSPRTKADPFLIALAALDGYCIVAEESLRNRPIGKIPGVCSRENIACITIEQMCSLEAGCLLEEPPELWSPNNVPHPR